MPDSPMGRSVRPVVRICWHVGIEKMQEAATCLDVVEREWLALSEQQRLATLRAFDGLRERIERLPLPETSGLCGGCPATREAVIERELAGEIGCPICGRTAEDHYPESPPVPPLARSDDTPSRGLSGDPS